MTVRPSYSDPAIAEANARRVRMERRRVRDLQQATREPEPDAQSRKIMDALDEAVAAKAKADAARMAAQKAGDIGAARIAKSDQVSAVVAIRAAQEELGARVKAQRDERWVTMAVAESVRLETGRDGEVEVSASGQVRMKARDGLHALLGVKDGLTADQYDGGMAFRAGWEVRSVDVGSQLGNNGGGTGHDNDRFVLARLNRAKSLALLGTIERAVAVQCRDEPATLQMLRRVAGDGHSLSCFGDGRAFTRNLAALKRALDVAVTVTKG